MYPKLKYIIQLDPEVFQDEKGTEVYIVENKYVKNQDTIVSVNGNLKKVVATGGAQETNIIEVGKKYTIDFPKHHKELEPYHRERIPGEYGAYKYPDLSEVIVENP